MLSTMASAHSELILAEKGKSKAIIVANGHMEQADELQSYLQKVTGAKFEMLAEGAKLPAGKSAIVLRVVDKLPNTSDRETAKQAYRIRIERNRLHLQGASTLGLTYAVYGFLEDHLGLRFYDFQSDRLSYRGPGFEVIPARPTLKLNRIDETQEPAFPIRGFIYYIPIDRWLLKNRGGGMPAHAIWANHNFYSLIPPKKYFGEHPDWFPFRDGKRQHDWSMGLCGTNVGLAKELADQLMLKMAKQKDPSKPISAAQGDGFTGCQCEECRALVHREGTEAAPLLLMLNRALEITSEKFPENKVITFAYFDTLPVPKTLRPHRNLWINVVSSSLSQNAAGDQVGTIRNNPSNRGYAKAIHDWPKVAPGRVAVWHWSALSHFTEWPDMYSLADNVRYMQECGIAAVQLQVGWGSLNWAWLRNWLFLKLCWNPQADADQLIEQFVKDYYGRRAAPHILKCLKLSYQAYRESGFAPTGVRWTGWPATRFAQSSRASSFSFRTRSSPRRLTSSVRSSPGNASPNDSNQALRPSTGRPSTDAIRSPTASPPRSAGPSVKTWTTCSPPPRISCSLSPGQPGSTGLPFSSSGSAPTTSSDGIANPSDSPRPSIAVFTPTTRPLMSNRGPPELPWLIAASVCMKRSNSSRPRNRLRAERMPRVTVCP